MDPEGLPVAAMGLAAPVAGHPLRDVAPLLDGPDLLSVAPVVEPFAHTGLDILPVAPLDGVVVHPGLDLLPLGPDVDQDPNDDHALDALLPADLAPFQACDDIEGNPNPWVQVERHRPPRQQGAHLVAPVDSTGDVDDLEENTVDEFKDAFWLTKITQYRVSRRSTKSRRRTLVGVRSGPGVFVFNY